MKSPGPSRTPTSTHFLCSAGLASHVRGRAPASEKYIATAATSSRPPSPETLPPEPARSLPRPRPQRLGTTPRNSNVSSHWTASEPLAFISQCYRPRAMFNNVSLDQSGAGSFPGPPPQRLAPPLLSFLNSLRAIGDPLRLDGFTYVL